MRYFEQKNEDIPYKKRDKKLVIDEFSTIGT
jgi:hypothetical protein